MQMAISGNTLSHRQRQSTAVHHGCEHIQIGYVVTKCNRHGTGKRRLLHQPCDTLPLVDPGRFDFYHPASGQTLPAGCKSTAQRLQCIGERDGHESITALMDGNGTAFIFNKRTRITGDDIRNGLA